MSQLKPLSALFVITTALAVGCDYLPWPPPLPTEPGPGPVAPAPGSVTRIEYGKHYGFCVEYCKSDLTLGADGRGTVVYSGNFNTSLPPITRAVALAPGERDAIFRAADKASAQPWQDRYGCPDCADGGAIPLAVERAGKVQKTVLDATMVPPQFADLSKLLDAVIAAHPRVAALTTCKPGVASAPGVQVSNFAIQGDTATFTATFGGGCAAHTFEVCWNGAFLESSPVQASLFLLHTRGADDACKAIVTHTESVSLSRLREAYQQGYQTSTGKISVGIAGKAAGALYQF